MRLSIIVPVYNAADHLEACLASLTHQNNWAINHDYEVVVVDDGSTDRTREVARSFPVRLIAHKENQGRVKARQTGAKLAKAQQLLFVDSRVEISSNFFDTLFQNLKKYPCILAGGYQVDSHPLHWSRLFTLIRQKWYGDRFWPTPKRSHWIIAQNFVRSPKGMGVFSIPKHLFWRIQPKDHSRWQNDDTKLLETLVFDLHIPILRLASLKWQYSFRNTWLETLIWLTNRGTYFASYYLQPQHRLFWHITYFALIFFSVHVFIIWKFGLFAVCSTIFALLLALGLYLSKHLTDLFAIWIHFPVMILFFAFGIIRFWWLQLLAYRKETWFRSVVSAIVIFLFLVVMYQNRQVLQLLTSFSWKNIAALISLYAVFLTMNGLFLREILRAFAIQLPTLSAVAISNLSTVGNTFLPARGGAAWRATYLYSRYALSLSDFLATLTAGYFITFNVNSFLTLISLVLSWQQGKVFPLNLFLLFLTIWILTGSSMFFPRFWLQQQKFLPHKISRGLKGWLKLMDSQDILLKLLAISFGNVFLSALLLWGEYRTLDLPNISLLETITLSSTASLGLFVSITPAAFGIREGLLMITAQLIQIEPNQALAVGLLDRAISLLSLLIITWPSIWIIQRSSKTK